MDRHRRSPRRIPLPPGALPAARRRQPIRLPPSSPPALPVVLALAMGVSGKLGRVPALRKVAPRCRSGPMDDALAALKLQIEWGADEALDETPVDRTRPALTAPAPRPPQVVPAPSREEAPAPLRAVLPVARTTAPAARAEQAAGAADSLAALRTALAEFDNCPLRDTATNLVFGEGDEKAR